jgi:capsular polysaccharide biosynthesis protein
MLNKSPYHHDGSLDIFYVINVLKKYKKTILLLPVVFASVSLLFSWLFITPRYQVFAVIEIGQVNGKLIEEAAVVEERMKDRSFISNVIARHPDIFKYEKNLSAEEAFIQKTLEVKKSKDAPNLISFNLLGRSREVAFKKATSVFETLKVFHDGVFNTNVGMINQQIQLINDQINLLNKDRSLKGRDTAVLNSYNAVVDFLVLQDQVRQLRELQNQKMALTMSLSSAVSYKTRLLGSIWVSQEPVTPKYEIIALVALLMGIFVAIFSALLGHKISE